MACDPATLTSESRCLATLSPRQLLAVWAYLVCSGGIGPPSGSERITEEGDTRITEEGDTRIIE